MLTRINKLTANKFYDIRYRLFAKTVCLIIAYCSEDSSITPEGLLAYTVPPVLLDAFDAAPKAPTPS